MLSRIITKEVNRRILGCLLDGEASLSEVARKTKTTKANVLRALREMEKEDIVRKKIQGKTHIYKINLLHKCAATISEIITIDRREIYLIKIGNIQSIIHSFLSASLKGSYRGCIFFGSSISRDDFKDIDVFVIADDKKTAEITQKLKLIDKRISPLFGSTGEIERGIDKKDMLYKNIVDGIPFGIEIFNIKYKDAVLRKQDITERFIIAYREILSCVEFREKLYRKVHLEKGIMDFLYSILNYFDYAPHNDTEAISLFKKALKGTKPKTIKEVLNLIKKYSWFI